MAEHYTVYVGTFSQGVWRGEDLETEREDTEKGYSIDLHEGDRRAWKRAGWTVPDKVFHLEAQSRAVAIHPQNSNTVLVGDEEGLFRSDNGGRKWERVAGALAGVSIWSLAFDPSEPNTVFAGSRPAALFRSRDGGRTWHKLSADLPQKYTYGQTRVTNIKVDPLDPKSIWAGVEEGGVYRSVDGGDVWTHIPEGASSVPATGHDVTIVTGAALQQKNGSVHLSPGKKETVLVTGPDAVVASDDAGKSWRPFVSAKNMPLPALGAVAVKPDDPQMIFLGISETDPAVAGGIMRSRDGGATWEQCNLPQKPNSGIFNIAMHPSNPRRIWAASLLGELYHSENAGDTWEKPNRELTEIRALTWVPKTK